MKKYQHVRNIEEIDWAEWEPVEEATLVFVIQNDKILLIEKKRGLGAGKVNGPGGRLEAGETPAQCAVRECQEELHITPQDVQAAGELNFQFVDGHSIRGFVFTASAFEGVPTETEEAAPFWESLDKLPFERMWADDREWFPWMLRGEAFIGRFVFDEDRMLGQEISPVSKKQPSFLTGKTL